MPNDPMSVNRATTPNFEMPTPAVSDKKAAKAGGNETVTASEAFRNSTQMSAKTESKKFSITEFARNFAKTISDFASDIKKSIQHSKISQRTSMTIFRASVQIDSLSAKGSDESSKYKAANKIMHNGKNELQNISKELANEQASSKDLKSLKRQLDKLEAKLDYGQKMAQGSKQLNATEKGLINSNYLLAKNLISKMKQDVEKKEIALQSKANGFEEMVIPDDLQDAPKIDLNNSPFDEFVHPNALPEEMIIPDDLQDAPKIDLNNSPFDEFVHPNALPEELVIPDDLQDAPKIDLDDSPFDAVPEEMMVPEGFQGASKLDLDDSPFDTIAEEVTVPEGFQSASKLDLEDSPFDDFVSPTTITPQEHQVIQAEFEQMEADLKKLLEDFK